MFNAFTAYVRLAHKDGKRTHTTAVTVPAENDNEAIMLAEEYALNSMREEDWAVVESQLLDAGHVMNLADVLPFFALKNQRNYLAVYNIDQRSYFSNYQEARDWIKKMPGYLHPNIYLRIT